MVNLDVDLPLGVLTSITGVSGSGKSTLISQFLVETVAERLGHVLLVTESDSLEERPGTTLAGEIQGGLDAIGRLVVVDQKPIGRTPRSNLATYTGLFDQVRRLFAATTEARRRKYDAGRFSFNMPKGRCPKCEGEGFVSVELLFLPSVYAPCPACHGARYNDKTLEIKIRGKSVAEVLDLTVDAASEFFEDVAAVRHALEVIPQVGLGYLRLGQPATEALRWRGATHQAGNRGCSAGSTATRFTSSTSRPLVASGGRRASDRPAENTGRCRQQRRRGRARHGRGGSQRLDRSISAPAPETRAEGSVAAGPPEKVAQEKQGQTAKHLHRTYSPAPARQRSISRSR